jgi:hypothetical protein
MCISLEDLRLADRGHMIRCVKVRPSFRSSVCVGHFAGVII